MAAPRMASRRRIAHESAVTIVKRKAHEVGLSHIDGDASVQEVLHESDNIEAQKNVANVVSVVCTNKIQVNL